MKNKNNPRIYSKAALVIFSIGVMIVVAGLIYMIANLEKVDTLILPWIVATVIGMGLIVIGMLTDRKMKNV